MYDAVNAGGDTDSNASIVGALLGALNGTAIFDESLRDGFQDARILTEQFRKFADYISG